MVTKEIILDILKDKTSFTNIVKEFPGLYSACVTIKQNISQQNVETSLNKIISFSETNEKFKNLILDLIPKIESMVINENNISGLILEIDNNHESYSKLIERSKKEKWNYKGLSVTIENNKLKIFFY